MTKKPSPHYDQLRAMREAKFAPPPRKRVPAVIKNEITRAYTRGDKTVDIERDLGVSRGYSSQIAKQAGKPLRRPRQPKESKDAGAEERGGPDRPVGRNVR
jgi:hypothetical protein